jgi:hypothetical protein
LYQSIKEEGMYRWTFGVLCLALFGSIVVSINSHADSADEMEKRLAGAHAREWVFKKFETYMGAGNKCKQGESYRFKADHTVTISRCVNGEIHDEAETWSIESDQLETRLAIGTDHYILKFSDDNKGHFMLLRTKPRIKTEATTDKIFQLAAD